MTVRRLLLTLLAAALAGTAAAQCSRGPTDSTVTLPGFLAVYYAQFRSFAEQDAAEFYGGVCVTAVGGEWTVMADSVRLDDLSGDIRLRAPQPTLYVERWRVHGDLLEADARGLTLVNARLEGPEASGFASGLQVDLVTGQMRLVDVQLAGSAFAVRGQLAVLEGTALRVEDAGLTTCIGLQEAPYEVLGQVAQVDLQAREVRLHSGTLRLGRLLIPLKEEVVVSDQAFADFQLPLKVAFVSGAPTRPGAGLGIRVVGIPLAQGVELELGGTGLDAEHVTQGVALLRLAARQAEAGGSSQLEAVAGLEAGAPYLSLGVTRQVAPWLRAEFGVLSGAQPAKAARHEGRLALVASTQLPRLAPDLTTTVTGSAFAAVTAVTPGAGVAQASVAGARLGAASSARAVWRPAQAGTFTLEAGAQATYYPDTWGASVPAGAQPVQWGVRLAPSWRYATGPVTLSLAYEARLTNAGSPFGTEVDRMTPLQRAQGSVRLAGDLGASTNLAGALGVQASYDFVPADAAVGLRRLSVDGELSYKTDPFTYQAAARTELAGLLGPAGRDPYVELKLTATRDAWPVLNPGADAPNVPHGTLQVGLLSNYSLKAGSQGLQALELSAAAPFAFDTFELRPYLAFDFAPTITSGQWPWWSGYGLDATFITCCGSVTLGVLNDRGAWGAGISVDLERRPPRADRPAQGLGIMPGE